VHEVTPAGLEQQLKDAMAEEIRTLARSMKHTQVKGTHTIGRFLRYNAARDDTQTGIFVSCFGGAYG